MVLIEQIDNIGLQSLERCLGDSLDVFWPAIQPRLLSGVRIKFEPEFHGDCYAATEGAQGFADEFFVCEWTVGLSGIEERNAAFDGRPNERDPGLFVYG